MRKILIFLVLIISINSFGQNPANYQYRVVYERLRGLMPDSVLHLPRYNGVPSGLRGGSSTQDGAIAGDTLNHAVYFYSGSLWNKLLSIRDTFSISTRAWRQKGIDSVVGLLSGLTDTHFGNTNLTQTANRTYGGAGFNYTLNNLGTWEYNHGGSQRFFSEGNILISGGTTGGTGNPFFQLESDNGDYSKAALGTNGTAYQNRIDFGEAADGTLITATNKTQGSGVSSFIRTRGDSISVEPFTGIINIDSLRTQYGDTTTWKPLVWSPSNKGVKKFNSWGEIGLGGGGTPTLQQVTTAGNITTNQMSVHDGVGDSVVIKPTGIEAYATTIADAFFGPGYIYAQSASGGLRWLSGSEIGMKNASSGFNTALKNIDPSASNEFKFRQGNASGVDTIATLADVRAGGGGGGSGTVTDVSVVSANGFSGSVATSTTTPAITLNLQRGFETWYQYYVDMSSTGFGGLYNVISGTGSAITNFNSSAIPDGWMYGRSLETGTTTTGLACHYGAASPGSYAAISISSSFRYNYGETVRLEDLSDGTDTYNYYAGFIDDITGGANVVDGIFFNYSHSLSSGQWQCITRSNGTSTTTASGVTVAADTDYKLEVTVYNGEAKFYINGSLVATNSTNIPTGSTRFTTIGNCIIKSAGTTSRKAYVEWIGFGKRSN